MFDEIFNYLLTVFKHMKCTEVWLTNDNMCYGFDDTHATFLMYKLDRELPEGFSDVLFNAKDFTKVVKTGKYKIIGDLNTTFVITDGEETCLVYKPNYSPMHFTCYRSLASVSFNEPPKYRVNNFDKTDDYKKYFGLKADDGIVELNIHGYPIVMYNRIIPANKADRVDLEIYDFGEPHFFVRYIINKSKNITIYVWTCYLKI